MKRTHQLKTVLLMIIMAIFHTSPAFASQNLTGSLDLFNESQISGWVYNEADPLSAPEIQIRISNSLTGETVKELSLSPTDKRIDLTARFGDSGTPGFTSPVDLSQLPDGIYSAALYKDGNKLSSSVHYTKGNLSALAALQPLGEFRLTAYCPCRSCSEGWGRHTRSGAIAQAEHTVAVDPRVIPLGSKLLINGTVYTAEDVGGAVKGNHIDIFFDTHAQTRQFGSSSAQVFIIK